MIGYALFGLIIVAGVAGIVWGCIPPRDGEDDRG